MAESRRAPNGNGRGRSSQSRKLSTRPGSIPRWAYVAMIAVPSVLIVILLAVKALKPREKEPEPQVDPNDLISSLEKQVPKLIADANEAMQLYIKEDPSAKVKIESVRERLNQWIEQWDRFMDSKIDPSTGKLPPELEGYRAVRRPINEVLSDLNRNTGF